jgi:flagellar hook-associated protein 2
MKSTWGSAPSSDPTSTATIDIPSSNTTLQEAVNSINQGNYGVTASVVTDSVGSRLVLASNTSGAAGNLTVTSSAMSFTTAPGLDAQLTVDGVPVDSSTNTITTAIPGVTLSLGAADPNTPVLISVEPDTDGAATALQNFVTDYNAVVGSINSQYTLDSNGNEGVLAGDSMLQTLQSDLLSMVSTSVSGVGNYVNLQSLGVEMQNDGTLQIDSSTLSSALSSDYSDVQKFFQSTSLEGWGQLANTQVAQLTDPTLGPVAVDINGLTQTNNDLSDQISDFQANMVNVQQQLTTQYQNLDALLIQYPLQMQEAASQLSSLPGASSTSSSQG